MIADLDPVIQALLAGLLTWGLTALGAAVVFVTRHESKKLLDTSLGFAAGVMMAASFWSLLAPAIEHAEVSMGRLACIPVAFGFLLGAAFVFAADFCMPSWLTGDAAQFHQAPTEMTSAREDIEAQQLDKRARSTSWRRILLLIVAVTVHNIPEGLAVGVGFGSAHHVASGFEKARHLAVGIGLQNLPEGLAVSLPLAAFGTPTWKAFLYGQLSGMCEPFAAVAGAALIVLAEPLLPYALAFAAGAMIYVVAHDIIPEAQQNGNGKSASVGCIVGFILMMCMDVGLA